MVRCPSSIKAVSVSLCVSVCVRVPAAGAQGVVLGPSAGPAWRMKERGGWGSALPAATRADFVKR